MFLLFLSPSQSQALHLRPHFLSLLLHSPSFFGKHPQSFNFKHRNNFFLRMQQRQNFINITRIFLLFQPKQISLKNLPKTQQKNIFFLQKLQHSFMRRLFYIISQRLFQITRNNKHARNFYFAEKM